MSKNRPKSKKIDGSPFNIAIVAANYNSDLVDSLLKNTVNGLEKNKVLSENIEIFRVPGSNEIPYVASRCAASQDYHCIIALGVVIAGDTNHHDVIAHSTAHSLQSCSMVESTPVINGIIVTNTREQAEERCTGKLNRGLEFAQSALTMAELDTDFDERFLGGTLEEMLMDRMDDDEEDWPDFLEENEDSDPWKS